MKIGVIGSLGTVGRTIKYALSYYYDVVGYDIKGDGSFEDIISTDVVFVCVPTPLKNGRLDCTIVDEVLEKLSSVNYKGIVVIKSTLRVGFMNYATRKYLNLKLVYMPEFLREKSALQWFVNPDRIVIAGKKEYLDQVLEIFECFIDESIPILVMDFISAEIAKLAHNAFIATKCSFTNEIERICKKFGADPFKVMECIWHDRRVKSPEHLRPGYGPYGGKCVPKDTLELINAYGESIVLRAVHQFNEKLKEEEIHDNER